jgi:hypothetical protein
LQSLKRYARLLALLVVTFYLNLIPTVWRLYTVAKQDRLEKDLTAWHAVSALPIRLDRN